MPRRAPYRTDQLEILKRKLSGILTLPGKEVAILAKRCHPDEVDPLATILMEAPQQLHHKWLAQIMGCVPRGAWIEGPDKVQYVSSPKAASMRFLSERPRQQEREKRDQLEVFRATLFQSLLSSMSPQKRRFHEPMLAIASEEELKGHFPGWTQPPTETNFGLALLYFESLLDAAAACEEQEWARENGHPETETLPDEVIRECSTKALGRLVSLITRWMQEDALEAQKGPNSMLALVSANLSANRAILEYSALDNRGAEAAELAVEFLTGLNHMGITEVPLELDQFAPENSLNALKSILRGWFSHGGEFIDPDGFFNRPMTDSDLNIVVTWAPEVQNCYIRSQALSKPLLDVTAAHGSSNNLFIFALTLVGAFYLNTRTSQEFTGRSNPFYSVFPGRALHKSIRGAYPQTHAIHVLMQTYGLIYFSNSNWGLLPNRVIARAETKRIKKAHLQQLLRFVTKGRSSAELVCLHRRLRDLTREPIDSVL